MMSNSSVDDEVFGEASLDVGAHEGHFEFEEGDLARVVRVQPVEHLLQKDILLLLGEGLTKGADEGLAHRLALVEVEPTVAVSVSVSERLLDQGCELLLVLLLTLFLLLGRLVNKVVEH